MSPTPPRYAVRYGLPTAVAVVVALAGAAPATAAPTTRITGLEKACTVIGTHGNDRLLGTHGYDVICGFGGDDVIDGGDGDDVMDAGPGNDTVGGGTGDDDINGRDGDDRLDGGSGADHVEGGTGVNTCPSDPADTSAPNSCSDLAPPVADLASARYVGETVLDNGVARTLRMQVRLTDDRSGVSSGSVHVAAPGGSTVYLQSPRLVGGGANDGVWEFTGTLPAYAPTGEWQVTQVFVTDRVNRNVLLARPAGLPAFTVTGVADLVPPAVDLASARYAETTFDNGVARTVRMQVRLTDDRSGVSSGSVYVAAPGGPTVYLQSPRLVSGTVLDGVWEFTGTLPAFAPAGQWQVTQVFVTDKVNRNVLLARPAGLPAFTVTGVADLAAPAVDLPSARYVGETVLDNGVARTVRLQVRLTDDRSGVSSGSVYLAAPGGPTVYLQSPRLVSGTVLDGVWEFTGTVPAYAPTGEWQVTQVFVTDRVNRNVLLAKPLGLPVLTVRCPPAA